MSDIFICKHCGKGIGIRQFGHHLSKIHQQKYEDYVKDNIVDFKHLNWKLCSDCGELCRSISNKCGKCYTKTHQIKGNQYIQCNYCKEKVHSKVLSQHLKMYHNVDFREYVKNNLNDFKKFGWSNCIVCGTVCVNRSKVHNNPTCSPECLWKIRKTWVGENSPRFGAILSEETKRKISNGNNGKKGLRGDLNPACRIDVRKRISKTRIERGVAKGKNNPMFGKTHTPDSIAKIFSHRKMNRLEKLVADELDKASIPYYFQFFITENGICKSYDFKIKDRPIILEIDGDFWHGHPEAKNHFDRLDQVKNNDILKNSMASNRGYKLIRFWERDIKKDPSIILKSIVG